MNKLLDLLSSFCGNKTFNRTQLKVVAIITMLIDHIGYIFFPKALWMRWLGRLALPIFIYQLVEGYELTSNFSKYFSRILFVAVLSEVPFDLAFFNTPFFWEYQSIFVELLICLFMLPVLDKTRGHYYFQGLIIFLFCVVAILLKADYNTYGILLTAMFYFCKGHFFPFSFIILPIISYFFCEPYQIFSVCSLLMIFFFYKRPKKSDKHPVRHNMFTILSYGFYPFHLVILYLAKLFI